MKTPDIQMIANAKEAALEVLSHNASGPYHGLSSTNHE